MHTTRPLRDSKWAATRLGYRLPEQRSAFWQFAVAHSLPMIRLGARKIMFDEAAFDAWIQKRNTGRAA